MENNSQGSILVDVIIAVHTPDRPIERAVASLVAAGLPTSPEATNRLRINVVCHNTDVEPIRRRIAPEHQRMVRFLHCTDGIMSPAGPFNLGLAEATGKWVAIMGSDDSVESGALAAWDQAARNSDPEADVVLAPMAHAGGRNILTPVVRRSRYENLDPVLDRLTYRTAPLGLMRLSTVRALELTFPTRYATGEDQSFSAKLWFSGARISYGRGLPRYLVHDDAVTRVTATQRSVRDDLRFATDLVESEWFATLTPTQQAAIATKILRVHVFGHVSLRAEAGTWTQAEAYEMAEVVRRLVFAAPRAARPLSYADRALLDAVCRKEPDAMVIKKLATTRKTYSNPRTWIPRDFSQWLHPEAPLRFMSASALLS